LLIQINAVSRRLSAAAFIIKAGILGTLGYVETDEPVHLAAIAHRVTIDHVIWSEIRGTATAQIAIGMLDPP
jgi:hypothetical protein